MDKQLKYCELIFDDLMSDCKGLNKEIKEGKGVYQLSWGQHSKTAISRKILMLRESLLKLNKMVQESYRY